MKHASHNSLHKQKGIGLIILFTVIILAGTVYFISAITVTSLSAKKASHDRRVLAQAKEALISSAVRYYLGGPNFIGRNGFLVCPEEPASTGEGVSIISCRMKNMPSDVGRLPWKTLGLSALQDYAGECLWYAVSASNKAGTARADMLNDDTTGAFVLFDEFDNVLNNSSAPESRIVAVIIAPGTPLSGQNRGIPSVNFPCKYARNNVSANDFLESLNGHNNTLTSATTDNIDEFVTITTALENLSLNDRIITIRQDEIFSAIKRANTLYTAPIQALGTALATCLQTYATNSNTILSGVNDQFRFPWPAAIDLAFTDYRLDGSYIDQNTNFLGRLPDTINLSNAGMPGHASADLITSCLTPTPLNLRLWQNWKDHWFYVVGQDYAPNITTTPNTSACTNCPTVAGTPYAALLIFSGERLINSPFNQLRLDPAIEPNPVALADNKSQINNYLEGSNATNITDENGTYADYTTYTPAELNLVNDIIFGISVENGAFTTTVIAVVNGVVNITPL